MKLNVYVLFDRIQCEFPFTFMAKNDEMAKRVCKGALIAQEQNIMNTDTDDKDIYITAVFDTETGTYVAKDRPEFVYHLAEIRAELLAQIRASKAAAGEEVKDEVAENE